LDITKIKLGLYSKNFNRKKHSNKKLQIILTYWLNFFMSYRMIKSGIRSLNRLNAKAYVDP
jgi:hypothetical protein